MKDNKVFSPKQVAMALGVSEASIKRWVDKGLIECIKTDGGHRKVPLYSLMEYVHKNNIDLVNPEVINIPRSSGRIKDKMDKFSDELQEAFKSCDEYKIQGIIYDLYTSGQKPEKIFDDLLAPSLHKLGCEWEDGNVDAFQERRVIQICIRILYGFNSFFPPPEKNAPVALLGTFNDDPYTIPCLMIEVCLRALGWKTEFLGNDLPVKSYVKAVEMYKPDLLVLSISSCSDEQQACIDLQELEKTLLSYNGGFVIGGRGVPADAVKLLKKTLFVPNILSMIEQLDSYRKSL